MFALPSSVRVFLCRRPTDMRKSFDGLCALVVGVLEESPTSGHLFVFRNARGDRLKALWFDRDGLAIYYKRLQQGVFHFPAGVDGSAAAAAGGPVARLEVTSRELSMILSGLELKNIRKLPRFAGTPM